jgi:hypothetical protein
MIRPAHYRCEVDELPPAAAEAFEKYIAASLSIAWIALGGRDRDSSLLLGEALARAESRFVGLLNHQKEWRWGGSTWRIGHCGVERVAG